MAITFFGFATTPADNGTNTANPTAVTPPASMTAGDLCVMVAQARYSSGTLAMSQAGGQTWNTETQWSQTTCRRRMFWCTFNGTWSADPSVTMGSTTCNDVQMLVFRPTSTGHVWAKDIGPTNAAQSAPSSPYTCTITGQTNTKQPNVTIACWACIAANTWGTLTGGWTALSTTQFRNTSGSDQSSSFAYLIQATAGATGNVSQNESAGTAGAKTIVSFYAYAPLVGAAAAVSAASMAVSQPTLTRGIIGQASGSLASSGVLSMGHSLLGEVSTGASISPLLGIIFLLGCLHTTLEEHIGQKKGG